MPLPQAQLEAAEAAQRLAEAAEHGKMYSDYARTIGLIPDATQPLFTGKPLSWQP